MGRHWPAIDVQGSSDPGLIVAAADEFSPTAVDERPDSVRLFFATTSDRDAACATLAERYVVRPIEVDDEDWARRSQQNLAPVTVGRVIVAPPWAGLKSCATTDPPPATSAEDHSPMLAGPHPYQIHAGHEDTKSRRKLFLSFSCLRVFVVAFFSGASRGPQALTVIIQPSMGFGTGHHATTRLCLAALQLVDLANAFVLDVGTGSGVLAIAAVRLGAARALGIDTDADAIRSAHENLAFNLDVGDVAFEVADLTSTALPTADIVTANLTGALLVRAAARLAGAVRPGGTLILSGFLPHERTEILQAFPALELFWEQEEDGWLGLALQTQGGPLDPPLSGLPTRRRSA